MSDLPPKPLMKLLLSLIVGVSFTVTLAACTAGGNQKVVEQTPADLPSTLICAEAVPMRTEGWHKGAGRYRAWRAAGDVIVYAEGQTPTPGYQVRLARQEPERRPPHLTLYFKPPENPVIQVLTRFHTCARIDAPASLESVFVEDADGKYELKVEQVR